MKNAVEAGGATRASHTAFSSRHTELLHVNVDKALWVKYPPLFFHFNLLIVWNWTSRSCRFSVCFDFPRHTSLRHGPCASLLQLSGKTHNEFMIIQTDLCRAWPNLRGLISSGLSLSLSLCCCHWYSVALNEEKKLHFCLLHFCTVLGISPDN